MIIFLYGEDTFRSRQKLKELKSKFLRDIDSSGNSLAVLGGENTTLDRLNEIMASSSLFSKKRMIVIENIFSNKDKNIFEVLKDYLAKKESSFASASAKRWKTASDCAFTCCERSLSLTMRSRSAG